MPCLYMCMTVQAENANTFSSTISCFKRKIHCTYWHSKEVHSLRSNVYTLDSIIMIECPALSCLLKLCLGKDIQCHVSPYSFSYAYKSPSWCQATNKLGNQLGDCGWPLLIFLREMCGYVWLSVHFITPRVQLNSYIMQLYIWIQKLIFLYLFTDLFHKDFPHSSKYI